LHNVDVISTIDLGRMMRFHMEQAALATLAVQDRETSRYLLFDQYGQLCGRRTGHAAKAETLNPESPKAEAGNAESVRPALGMQALAFSGIHVISPALFAKMGDEGAFPIMTTYMHLAAQGEKIIAFRADECYWRDLGTPENVMQAARDLASREYLET